MERIVIDITGDPSKLQPLIDKMKEVGAVEQKNANQFSKNNNDQINQIESLKSQYKAAKKELENLSASGSASAASIANAAKRTAELKNKIEDAQKTLAAFNPEAKFAVVSQVARGVAGGFAAATGALAIFGKKSEEVQLAVAKIQAVMAFAQGISEVAQLGAAFKNLRILLAGATVATEAQAVANTHVAETAIVEATATNTATVATKGFTAALLTNPFTLALVAVTALVGALVYFSEETDNSKEAIDELNKSTDRYKDTIEKLTRSFENYKKIKEGEIAINQSSNELIIKSMQARGEKETDIAKKTLDFSKKTIDEKIQLVKDEIESNKNLLSETEPLLKKDYEFREKYLDLSKKSREASTKGERIAAEIQLKDLDKTLTAQQKQAIEAIKNREQYVTNLKLLQQQEILLGIEKQKADADAAIKENEINKKKLEEAKKLRDEYNQKADAYQKELEKIEKDGADKITQIEIDKWAALNDLEEKAIAAGVKIASDPKYIQARKDLIKKFEDQITQAQLEAIAQRNALISKANEEAAKEAFSVAQNKRDEQEKDDLQAIELKYLKEKNTTKKLELEKREEERKVRIEKLKEDAKNREDDIAFQRETQNKINAIVREGELDRAKSEKEIADERKKQQEEALKTIIDVTYKYYDDLIQNRIAGIDQQLQAEDDALKTQQDLAARGQKNTLAFEEKRKADLERARMSELEKQRRAKELEAFLNAFIAFSKEPNDPAQALPKALALIAVMRGAEAQFMEEGGIVGKALPANGRRHKSGRDILVHAEHGEGILSTKEMSNLGGESAFMKLKESLSLPLTQRAMPIAAVITNTMTYGKEIVNELQAVKQAVLSKREVSVDFDGLHNMVVSSVQSGVRNVTKYVNPKPLI